MPIVGIDFGTTTSAVAIVQDGKAQLLEDGSGRTLLPTVVYLPPGRDPIVGVAARNRLNLSPDRSFAGIKRLLGLKYRDPSAEKLATLFGWTLERGPDDAAAMRIDRKLWSAVDLSREVFSVLRNTAKSALDTASVRAVVTVPAGFTYAQRTALLNAAEGAGIDVEQLMNEPTAAAIAYGLDAKIGKRIAVFDLGGGTFDFTILEVQDAVFEVLSTTADSMLGSSDIDGAIAAHMADHLRTQYGVVVPQDKMSRLLPAAERMKIELSTQTQASAAVAAKWVGAAGRKVYPVSLTRDELETIARPLIAKCMNCVKRGLEAAGIEENDIHDIILVGGGTLMPLVHEMNAEFFGRTPLDRIDPEIVVATGAALWADQQSRPAHPTTIETTQNRTLRERSAIGLGVGTIAGIVDYVIPANAPVPARGVRHFTTSADHQRSLHIEVFQGTERQIGQCQLIGELRLENLPDRLRGETSVAVTFVLDTNGLVLVSAIDSFSGIAQEASLQSTSSADPATLEA